MRRNAPNTPCHRKHEGTHLYYLLFSYQQVIAFISIWITRSYNYTIFAYHPLNSLQLKRDRALILSDHHQMLINNFNIGRVRESISFQNSDLTCILSRMVSNRLKCDFIDIMTCSIITSSKRDRAHWECCMFVVKPETHNACPVVIRRTSAWI